MVVVISQKMTQSKKELIKYCLLILVAVMIIASVIVPLPYYIEVPGSAENVREFITVDDKRDKTDGSYMLTTVGIRRATAASLLTAKILPFQEIISKENLMGGSSAKEYDVLTDFQMKTSENMAKKVALDLADKSYDFKYQGVYVMGVTDTSDFSDKLKLGDVIKKVDGQTFASTKDFMSYIKKQKIGQQLTISYERAGKTKEVTGKLSKGPQDKKAAIGISLVDQTTLETKTDIKIDAGDIGGPSAGLMFTLGTYQLLSGKDLKQGREVAGTGTINSDGTVGSIGGIDKKVVAADAAGAEIFFAPSEDYAKEVKEAYPDLQTNAEEAKKTAKKISTKMKIFPVKTVQDALSYLNNEKKTE